MKLIALKNTKPYGHRVKAGETFEVNARNAKMLIAARQAALAPEGSSDPVYVRGGSYKRRDMRAEPATEANPAPVKKAKPVAAMGTPSGLGRTVGAMGTASGLGRTNPPPGAGSTDEADLMALTKAQLLEVAQRYQIEILARDSKAELVGKILEARAAAASR